MIELVIGVGAALVLFWVATRKPKVENKEVKAAVQATVCAETPKVVETQKPVAKAPAKRTATKKATPVAKKQVAKPAAKKTVGRKPKK